MTVDEKIQKMIDEGKLLNANQETIIQVFDAYIKGKDYALFQIVGYDKNLDLSVSASHGLSPEEARRIGEFLIDFANKYEHKPEVVEVATKKSKTKKA